MGRLILLGVELVHYETSHQKDAFVSTFFCLFLSLKIVTMFCNLVLLNACKYFTLLATLQFASVCCPRSFWIPGPSPRSMATVHLVRPGSHPRSITSDAYSPFTRPSCDRQSSKGRVTSSLWQASCSTVHGLFESICRSGQILRRFYIFAEEPCKSTIATSEPCSQIFKEAQPRPSEHSNYNILQTNILNFYLHVFYC